MCMLGPVSSFWTLFIAGSVCTDDTIERMRGSTSSGRLLYMAQRNSPHSYRNFWRKLIEPILYHRIKFEIVVINRMDIMICLRSFFFSFRLEFWNFNVLSFTLSQKKKPKSEEYLVTVKTYATHSNSAATLHLRYSYRIYS